MALEWQPEYPDWIPSKRRQATYEPLVHQNVSPIPLPSPPTFLIWLGYQPAQIWRRTLPTSARAVIVAPIPSVVIYTPTSWLPILPAWLPQRPSLPARLQQVEPFTISSLIGIGVLGAWRPTFPAQIWRTPQTRTGTITYQTPMSVLLGAAICLEWTSETLRNPSFTAEAVVSPTFTGETLTSPILSGEDLC